MSRTPTHRGKRVTRLSAFFAEAELHRHHLPVLISRDELRVIVFLSPEMMFATRLMSAATATGAKLAIALTAADLPAKLSSETRLVIIDLAAAPGAIDNIVAATRTGAPQAKILAYGPHVDIASLQAATVAGCDVVMSRGEFNNSYATIFRELVAS